MGNVCCGNKDESQKASAFQSSSETDIDEQNYQRGGAASSDGGDLPGSTSLHNDISTVRSIQQQQLVQQAIGSAGAGSGSSNNLAAADPQEAARLQAAREEEARLQLILQTAGRGMVAVRSTRGSTAYYDQGFAAALGQHLEQTTQFPERLPVQLPASTSPELSSVYSRLSQPMWQDIVLGDKTDGLAGCAGENPHTYFDQKAEAFLDEVRPKKENLFAGVSPMVENLL